MGVTSRLPRRQRHWRLGTFAAVALSAVALPASMTTSTRGTAARPGLASHRRGSDPRTTVRSVRPEAPAALAVGPDGVLYLTDTMREEILSYTPRRGFRVVAGTGQKGRTLPGARATRARLDLEWYSGLTVAKSGTVAFTEEGRIWEVTRRGTLAVVAGGGIAALGKRPLPARSADLGFRGDGLGGLTFGPRDELYVGTADGVYRLANGVLHRVVGEPLSAAPPPPHWRGVYSSPAIPQDFAPAVHLAFDRTGDLFVSGGGAFGLYEHTAAGTRRFVEVLRAQGGAPGALATGPAGTVVAASDRGLQRVAANGTTTTVRARWPLQTGPLRHRFFPAFGVGVAVGRRGQIYVDTDHGDAVPNQGLLEVLSRGRVRWLWRAPPS